MMNPILIALRYTVDATVPRHASGVFAGRTPKFILLFLLLTAKEWNHATAQDVVQMSNKTTSLYISWLQEMFISVLPN